MGLIQEVKKQCEDSENYKSNSNQILKDARNQLENAICELEEKASKLEN